MKTIYARLAPEFLNAIVLDQDAEQPGGVAHIVRDSNSDAPPVYKVAQTAFITGKLREGIIEEVRDFDEKSDYAWNDPEHPRHDEVATVATPLSTQATGYSVAQMQSAIDEAVKNALAAQQATAKS